MGVWLLTNLPVNAADSKLLSVREVWGSNFESVQADAVSPPLRRFFAAV